MIYALWSTGIQSSPKEMQLSKTCVFFFFGEDCTDDSKSLLLVERSVAAAEHSVGLVVYGMLFLCYDFSDCMQ